MWYTAMNASMVDQLKFTRKCGATVSTNERIERTVETWMHNQMIFLCKTLAAFVTDVWPLTSMEFAVCHQMAFQWERTTALLANEWSLAATFGGEEEENSQLVIYCMSVSCNNITCGPANALASDAWAWNSFCIRCIDMDDRLNATANVCLSSVYGQTICRNERTHGAVHRCEHVHGWWDDVLVENFCHTLRKRMVALLAHRRSPYHALQRLKSPPLDLSRARAPICNASTMWPVNRPHPLSPGLLFALERKYLRELKNLEIKMV